MIESLDVNQFPYGDKLPILSWFYNSAKKAKVKAYNLVTTHMVKPKSGLNYPALFRIYKKLENKKK